MRIKRMKKKGFDPSLIQQERKEVKKKETKRWFQPMIQGVWNDGQVKRNWVLSTILRLLRGKRKEREKGKEKGKGKTCERGGVESDERSGGGKGRWQK